VGDYRAYVDRDPYAFYSDSRERGPVCWDESMGAWIRSSARVRVALTDVELGGQVIRRGERAHPMNAAANQEPRHYPDPHRIQIDRSPLRDHLAFNAGPRFCVGVALARAEGAEVVEQVHSRSSGMDWVDGAGRPRFRGYMPRSFRPLFAALATRAT